MKYNRMFTIDEELREKLAQVNASKLVNELLTDYFAKSDKLTAEQLRARIAESQKEIERLKKLEKDDSGLLHSLEQRQKAIAELKATYPMQVLEILGKLKSKRLIFEYSRSEKLYNKPNPLRDFKASELNEIWDKIHGKNM